MRRETDGLLIAIGFLFVTSFFSMKIEKIINGASYDADRSDDHADWDHLVYEMKRRSSRSPRHIV